MVYFLVNATNVRPASGFEFDMPELRYCKIFYLFITHDLFLQRQSENVKVQNSLGLT